MTSLIFLHKIECIYCNIQQSYNQSDFSHTSKITRIRKLGIFMLYTYLTLAYHTRTQIYNKLSFKIKNKKHCNWCFLDLSNSKHFVIWQEVASFRDLLKLERQKSWYFYKSYLYAKYFSHTCLILKDNCMSFFGPSVNVKNHNKSEFTK